ncbi:MAG: thioesterase [Dysgonamonadaceae bacterium]|nr:thioesterase [Dysgonamonadaceae bacterium]MDD3355493.1 thioesterase [Dysgonamonadaceae bacterium]MDD3727754.1 thioesterase [Dysgonamonadaceae bacterium]MDD4246384.1 thioesterase [Dysgonamonadaceae bacterium]MDD4605496.1 thioesterase [Dysgonamonadaceae bacterium]
MTQQKSFGYKIEPEHIDFQKNISPIVLTDMILNAAGSDANEHGFGLMDLHKKNCSWVVSRFSMELEVIPTVGDNLSIETWVKDVGKVFTTRNFRLTNGTANVVGYSVLSWAILDLDTRRSVPLSIVPELNRFIVNEEIPLESPGRIPDIKGSVANSFEVKYSDVDLNVHTNVLKYLQCICDCFSLDFYSKRILKRVEINFLKELEYGDKGTVYYEEVAGNDFLFKLVTSEGVVVSRSRMVFENK